MAYIKRIKKGNSVYLYRYESYQEDRKVKPIFRTNLFKCNIFHILRPKSAISS